MPTGIPIDSNAWEEIMNNPTQGECGSYNITDGTWTITTNTTSDNATWYNTIPQQPFQGYYGYSGSDAVGAWGWQPVPIEEKKTWVERYKRDMVKAGLVNFLEKMEVEGVDSTTKGR